MPPIPRIGRCGKAFFTCHTQRTATGRIAGNEFVGALTISGLPKGPAGAVQVAVTVSLDAECVVTVEAREFRTRKTVKSTLATRYTSDEIAQKLGISQAKRDEANKSRGEELEKRAGGFWGRLKSLFKR